MKPYMTQENLRLNMESVVFGPVHVDLTKVEFTFVLLFCS